MPQTPNAQSAEEKAAADRQAQLDKEAAEKQAKADAEAKAAEEAAAAAEQAAHKAEDEGQPRAPRCPDCNERMEPYTEGDANPHKIGTAFCHHCGKRRQVHRNRVVD